jgi:hypothetical protein
VVKRAYRSQTEQRGARMSRNELERVCAGTKRHDLKQKHRKCRLFPDGSQRLSTQEKKRCIIAEERGREGYF